LSARAATGVWTAPWRLLFAPTRDRPCWPSLSPVSVVSHGYHPHRRGRPPHP